MSLKYEFECSRGELHVFFIRNQGPELVVSFLIFFAISLPQSFLRVSYTFHPGSVELILFSKRAPKLLSEISKQVNNIIRTQKIISKQLLLYSVQTLLSDLGN